MVNGDVPLVVCVSSDVGVREQVVRRLEDCGAVLMCADLDELRAMLFPPVNGSGAAGPPPGGARAHEAGGALPDARADEAGPPPHEAGAPPDPDREGVVRVGELVVDVAGHQVTWRGRPLPLTRLERELLGRLAGPPVGVWTYQRLFDAVWGKAYLGDTSILHSAVKRLRGKLRAVGGELGVETVRGVGYRLAVPG